MVVGLPMQCELQDKHESYRNPKRLKNLKFELDSVSKNENGTTRPAPRFPRLSTPVIAFHQWDFAEKDFHGDGTFSARVTSMQRHVNRRITYGDDSNDTSLLVYAANHASAGS